MRRRLRYLAALLAAIVGIVAAPLTVAAEDAPTAVLLVDGSGSMWARLPPDNRAKIDIVREKLTTILQTPSSTKVGLVSFGHRRRGDCSDVETIAAPDSARDGVLAPLAKLNPTGMGPLAAGLKAAADAIGTARPAQIVVVGDGADNCHQDACSVAKDIATVSPGVKIHVIEIGIAAADRARVSCIAEATGGHYYDAANSDELNAALDEATKLAILSPNAVPNPGAGAANPAAPPPPAGATLRASAALVKGGALLTVPIRWRIFGVGENKVLGETEASDIAAKLSAGSYDIEAKLGALSARQTISVEPGSAQSIIVPLAGAHLNVRATATKGGTPSPTAIVTVTTDAATTAIGRDGSVDLYLPPASYTLNITDGLAHASDAVTLAAGDDKPVEVVLGTGRIEVTATDSDGKAIENVLYRVFEDDPESPDGRREVARSRAPDAAFTLPAGTYYVGARSGAADIRERIAVGAGEVVKRQLTVALVPLKVSTTVAGSLAKPGQGILYRVDRLDGDKACVARAIGPDFNLNLEPGAYKVTAAIASRDLSASQNVTLQAGKPAAVHLDIQGGEVTFKPRPSEAAAATGDIYWEVTDAKGVPLWRAIGAETKALLAPGHYTVSLDVRGAHSTAQFDVRAGENQKIEVGS